MRAHLLLSGLICGILAPQARSAQLEDCLPIPMPAQDIEQRREAARAREQQEEASKPHIKLLKLTFRGQTGLPAHELRQIAKDLAERTYDDSSQWTEELQERVQDAWQHRGYFKTVVGVPDIQQMTGASPERRSAVSVSIDSGRLYRLNKIEIAGSSQFSPGELRLFFPIQDGDIFDTQAIRRGMDNLHKAYGEKGFIYSTVNPSTAVDEVHGLINLSLEVEEGKLFRFGEIKIVGLDPPQAGKLLRDSGLETGKIFDTSLVDKFCERNRNALPGDAEAIGDTQRRIDQQKETVDITMDFRACPQLSGDDDPD